MRYCWLLKNHFILLFLLFSSADNKRRTKHIARTLNPEWNETIFFANLHFEELRNKTLEITVWDYDRFKTNDFLGEVVLDLAGKCILFLVLAWVLCSNDE